MALANTAMMLAKWGFKTLVIDWDLEAPGLENFFKDYFGFENATNQKGIVDLLYAASNVDHQKWHISPDAVGNAQAAVESTSNEATPDKLLWEKYLLTARLREGSGTLHLLTAGQRDADYFSRVRSFDVQEFYKEKRGGFFIEKLRREWKKTYDFVLVDSRTGVTDIGGICTIQLPDILIILFTATEQGLNGAVDVAKKATAARQSLPFDRLKLLVVPIPSRFDTTVEHELSQKWLDRFENSVSALYADWLPRDVQRREMLELMKVPYKAYFSFGEKLAVIEEGTVDRTGIGYAYETLSALIANKLENAKLLREDRDGYVRQVMTSYSVAGERAKSRVNVELISEVLRSHRTWLDSGGAAGEPANFRKGKLRAADFVEARLERALFAEADLNAACLSAANISGADFSDASLQGAILDEADGDNAVFKNANLIDVSLRNAHLVRGNFQAANLQGAELVNANLTGANLDEANLARANLKNTRLHGAILENANVLDAIGLTMPQLGGANLAGAKLPGNIIQGESVNRASALLITARSMFYGLIALCVYFGYIVSWETTDALLLTNGGTPGLGFGINLASFFTIAPIALVSCYIFFHVYLQMIWEQLARLPAVFPDGRALDEVLPGWFTAVMVRNHFNLLREKPLRAPQRVSFIFLAWWLVPLTLLLFFLQYLPLRNWVGTSLQILSLTTSVGAGMLFYRLAVRTLRVEEHPSRKDA